LHSGDCFLRVFQIRTRSSLNQAKESPAKALLRKIF
jgi:hypothetical protein